MDLYNLTIKFNTNQNLVYFLFLDLQNTKN